MELTLKSFLSFFNEGLTFFIIFPCILLLGMYLTIQLNFLQFSKLKMSFSYLLRKDTESSGDITHYQAVAAVLAGNFGTGNISGMAIALTTGGPGALVWMWVIAFLGAAIQYASCVLGMKYREKNSQGEYVGGPMYYLTQGLKNRKLAITFSLSAILGALTVGNFTQVNSLVLPLAKIGFPPIIGSIIVAVCVGVVILGGMQRFAKTASSVVPIMALLYFGSALIILMMNFRELPAAIGIMFKAAANPAAVLGGSLGYGIIKTITTGFDRGIFATDAGTGIVPVLQSGVKTNHAVVNGIITLVAPVLVMIVCSTTGLVLIVTGAWLEPGLASTNMVTYAFQKGLGSTLGEYVVMIALFLFSYTTILAWACFGERAVGYLWGIKRIKAFQYFFILMIPVGALFQVDLVWLLADISISFMLAINMIGVAGLSKEVIADSKAYFKEETSEILLNNQDG